jgi:hypothetical protein
MHASLVAHGFARFAYCLTRRRHSCAVLVTSALLAHFAASCLTSVAVTPAWMVSFSGGCGSPPIGGTVGCIGSWVAATGVIARDVGGGSSN